MAEMGMHSVRYMRGYIRVAFWKRWACCPLYARLYLGGFLAEVGMLSSICEAIFGWLFGRGGHAIHYMQGYIRVTFW